MPDFSLTRRSTLVTGASRGIGQAQAVSHFMSEPHEPRHIFVHNHQAILSPPWSIRCGYGSANYAFIRGAGENLDYDDMGKSPCQRIALGAF